MIGGEFSSDQSIFTTLSKRQKEIVELLKIHKTMTPDELRSSMSEALPERTLRDELNRMKTLGIIDATGKTRTRKWYLTL